MKALLQTATGRTDTVPGAIVSVQTFGSLLDFHPHLHILVTWGVCKADGAFVPVEAVPEAEEVQKLFRHQVLRRLLDHGVIDADLVRPLLVCEAPKARGRTYNTTGEHRSLKEAVECVQRLVPGAEITLEPGRTGMVWRFDGAGAAADLGYQPHFGLEHRFRETINAVRSRSGLPPS